jgi:hypothetical protein
VWLATHAALAHLTGCQVPPCPALLSPHMPGPTPAAAAVDRLACDEAHTHHMPHLAPANPFACAAARLPDTTPPPRPALAPPRPAPPCCPQPSTTHHQSVYEDVARDTNRGHTVEAVKECFCSAKDAGFKVRTPGGFGGAVCPHWGCGLRGWGPGGAGAGGQARVCCVVLCCASAVCLPPPPPLHFLPPLHAGCTPNHHHPPHSHSMHPHTRPRARPLPSIPSCQPPTAPTPAHRPPTPLPHSSPTNRTCPPAHPPLQIVCHMMPDLPNVGWERDIEAFREFFESPDFRADGLKLYPTLVIRGSRCLQGSTGDLDGAWAVALPSHRFSACMLAW